MLKIYITTIKEKYRNVIINVCNNKRITEEVKGTHFTKKKKLNAASLTLLLLRADK